VIGRAGRATLEVNRTGGIHTRRVLAGELQLDIRRERIHGGITPRVSVAGAEQSVKIKVTTIVHHAAAGAVAAASGCRSRHHTALEKGADQVGDLGAVGGGGEVPGVEQV